MNFIDACAPEQVAPGQSLALCIGGRDVALFNVDGGFHAIENSCPHAGGALSSGRLSGCVVACPSHGLRFNVTTGAHVSSPELAVATFPVKVAGGRVLVSLGK